MIVALGVAFPYKVYANTTNPFTEHDKSYNEQLLSTKSTYTEVKPSIRAKKDKILEINAENRYLVKFGEDVSLEQINHLINGYTYKIIGKSSHRLFRIEINNLEGFKVNSKSMVESIELDTKTTLSSLPEEAVRSSPLAIKALSLPKLGITPLSAFPNDPGLSSQWAINALSLPNAWNITKGSDATYVAVIDSGVNRYHEDLQNDQVRNGWDILADDYVYLDYAGHGTEVTGVIAATPNNSVGIAGVCWNVAIIPIAVVYPDGAAYTSDIIDAIYLATDAGCKVINLSLGGPSYSAYLDVAVQYATSMGSIVVASAGNDSNSTIKYPASLNNVISVGSINKYLSHSYFSNNNSYVDVSAPGEDILTLYDDYYGTSYTNVDGTSFSSPYVAGIAALAATVSPNITAAQFKEAIVGSSTDLGSAGRDNNYGYGLINAEKLLNYVTRGAFVSVTNVSLNKTNLTIKVGTNDTLSATIAPTTATNKNVTWSSSNTAVATVDSNGKVVGVKAGSAVITVTTVDGSKKATCTVTVPAPVSNRLAGNAAEQTAVAIADQTGWMGTAILASSTSYGMVDALTAGPLSLYLKAPILLTGAENKLDAATKVELVNLKVTKVYVASGTAVIRSAVLAELKAMNITVIPLGGYDRSATSVNIARQMVGVTKVAIANGVQDALSIAAIASAANQPILLTEKDELPASVRDYLKGNPGIKTSDVIGGTGIISDAVKTRLPNATRHAGYSAYDTNNQVIQDFVVAIKFDKVYVANGVTGIDALAGAPLAALTKSAIVLTDGVSNPVAGAFVKSKCTANSRFTALGGTSVVPASVLAYMED